MMEVPVGQKFGKLTVIGPKIHRNVLKWEVKCDCGKKVVVAPLNVSRGRTKSCGCLLAELTKARSRWGGRSGEPEYRVWSNMVSKRDGHSDRGPYFVEPSWIDSYETFYNDVGPRPSPKHQFRRINPALGYTKANASWRVSSRWQ
jgi:hypothetical protein